VTIAVPTFGDLDKFIEEQIALFKMNNPGYQFSGIEYNANGATVLTTISDVALTFKRSEQGTTEIVRSVDSPYLEMLPGTGTWVESQLQRLVKENPAFPRVIWTYLFKAYRSGGGAQAITIGITVVLSKPDSPHGGNYSSFATNQKYKKYKQKYLNSG
jgi:hypothetical protein